VSTGWSVDKEGKMITVSEFELEAREFLDQRVPRMDHSEESLEVRLPLVGSAGEDLGEAMKLAREWAAVCYDAGFGWIDGPREFGGRGLTEEHAAAFRRLVAEYDAPEPLFVRTGTSIIGPTIQRYGAPSLVADLLPRVHRGDIVLCQLFSEPEAGSDLASVKTRAQIDGDRIVVSGQKVWSSGAVYSDLGECLVRVSGVEGREALAMVLVDLRLPGVTIKPITQMTGGSDFCEIFLDDVEITRSALIGEVGQGWPIAVDTLLNERRTIGSELIPADAIITMLRRKAGATNDDQRRLAAVQAMMSTQIAARLAADLERRDPTLLPLAKLGATRALTDVAKALTVLDGVSLIAGDDGLDADSEFVCGVPGFRIGGGSDEVLRSLIGERVLGLPRDRVV
jgi:alkylation response protein AidB-like acyl-CoA dehydrogenase